MSSKFLVLATNRFSLVLPWVTFITLQHLFLMSRLINFSASFSVILSVSQISLIDIPFSEGQVSIRVRTCDKSVRSAKILVGFQVNLLRLAVDVEVLFSLTSSSASWSSSSSSLYSTGLRRRINFFLTVPSSAWYSLMNTSKLSECWAKTFVRSLLDASTFCLMIDQSDSVFFCWDK